MHIFLRVLPASADGPLPWHSSKRFTARIRRSPVSSAAAAGTADSVAESTMTPADNSAVMVPDSSASDAEGSDSNANE